MKEKPFLVSSHGWKRQRERESERQREKLVEEGALLICKLLLRSSSVFPLQNSKVPPIQNFLRQEKLF